MLRRSQLFINLGFGLLAAGLAGCAGPAAKRTAELELANGELSINTYKKLGISIALPRDTMDVFEWSQKWYEQDQGRKQLGYVLAKITYSGFARMDESIIWSGYINIFTPEQFKEWQTKGYANLWWDTEKELTHGESAGAPEIFDTIRVQTKTEKQFGYEQRVFRIDRKAKDGHILQSFISRCEYVENGATRERDLIMITNILQSVNFVK